MALYVTLGRTARAGLGAPRARAASSLAEGGGMCSARGSLPACPPAAGPVCCAPPQGASPPCARPCPPLSLTCRDAKDYVPSSHACLPNAHPSSYQPSWHDCDQDPVALRLQIARNTRRAHYEWEVAYRAAAPPAAPACPAPYALGGERECARATDGCTHAVLQEQPAQYQQVSRCATLPGPSPAPPRCRRPTIVERLRAHPPDCQSARRTHTSVTLAVAAKSLSSVSGGLEGMLRSREQLKEAGLGRVVTDTGAGAASQGQAPSGRLELSVPPGTERVAVHVSMTHAAGGSSPAPDSASVSCPRAGGPQHCFPCGNLNKRPVPCGPATPCGAAPPTRCPPCPKATTKRSSSTSAFMANTIVVNS